MILVGIYGEPADTGIYDHHTTLAETKAAGGEAMSSVERSVVKRGGGNERL